jgi:hypothetical protein
MSASQQKTLPDSDLAPDASNTIQWNSPFIDSDPPTRPTLSGWYDTNLDPPAGGRFASRTEREVCDAFGLASASLTTLYNAGILTWIKDGLFIASKEGIEALRKRKRYSGCLQPDVEVRTDRRKESQRGALWLNETSSKQFTLARANGIDRWGRPHYFVARTEEKKGWEDGPGTLRNEGHVYDRRHGSWRNWNGYLDY